MDKIVVEGERRLKGTVRISGSKNAVLPVMASTLLADGSYRIENVPELRDVRTMSRLLHQLGCTITEEDHALNIQINGCETHEAPYDLVKTMRASIYVLGPLLSRYGFAKVSLPGGCAWGPRPVNLHIDGLQKMGADIRIEKGYIVARSKRLKGATLTFDNPSVGATGNLMMAAVLAEGKTIIKNAAKEPEIGFLARFLQNMGAQIEGVGESRLVIEGVTELHSADAAVIPDRIETGTFLVAGHMTGGSIRLERVQPMHLMEVLKRLEESGATLEVGNDWIHLQSNGKVRPVDIRTSVYPGFPTDMQAQWMALNSIARGSATITESIFTDRFTHVAELRRLGADITLDGNVAVVKGVSQLSGAPVMSTDLRASASLILAGLKATGRTEVSRVYHIDRGYEHIECKFQELGARMWREQEELVT